MMGGGAGPMARQPEGPVRRHSGTLTQMGPARGGGATACSCRLVLRLSLSIAMEPALLLTVGAGCLYPFRLSLPYPCPFGLSLSKPGRFLPTPLRLAEGEEPL